MSSAAAELILQAAKEQNVLPQLLQQRELTYNSNPFIYACYTNRADVLASLINVDYLHEYTNIADLLAEARFRAEDNPQDEKSGYLSLISSNRFWCLLQQIQM